MSRIFFFFENSRLIKLWWKRLLSRKKKKSIFCSYEFHHSHNNDRRKPIWSIKAAGNTILEETFFKLGSYQRRAPALPLEVIQNLSCTPLGIMISASVEFKSLLWLFFLLFFFVSNFLAISSNAWIFRPILYNEHQVESQQIYDLDFEEKPKLGNHPANDWFYKAIHSPPVWSVSKFNCSHPRANELFTLAILMPCDRFCLIRYTIGLCCLCPRC